MAERTASTQCQLCNGALEPGFLLDRTDNAVALAGEWGAGEPQRSFWTGLKRPKQRYKIQALRCKECGYLMHFALPPDKPAKKDVR